MSSGSLSLPTSANGAKPPFTRPTANFHPSVWGDRFLSYVPTSAVGLFVVQHSKAKSYNSFSPKSHLDYMQQTMSNGGLSLPTSANGAKTPFTRPTANFPPSFWGDRFLSYVPTSAESDSHIQQAKLLKEDVRKTLVSPIDHNNFSFKLNFIDSVQRLGVSYHFEHEIDSVLCQIYDISTKDNNIIAHSDHLYQTALLFRLLRQHGYRISSSMCSSTFNQFLLQKQ